MRSRYLPYVFAAILAANCVLSARAQEQNPALATQEQKPANAAAKDQVTPEIVNGVEMDKKEDGGLSILKTREDYSKLTLQGSDLVSEPVLPGGHEENKDFVRDLIRVQWRYNDPIDLYIIRPTGVKNPPVVLYLYGFPTDTDRFRNDDYCRRITANGAAAVGFVSALTGQRYHSRPMKQWFVSELPESLATTVHDVQMILNFMQTVDEFDMTRVGMFGQGSGAAIAVLAASADPRIKALDLLQPWGDWPDWLTQSTIIPPGERGTYATPENLKKLEPLEPARALATLKDRKIRIQFVDMPPPQKSTKVLEDAAPKDATIVHFDGTKQLFSAAAGGRLFQWLPQQLKPQGPVQAAAVTPGKEDHPN